MPDIKRQTAYKCTIHQINKGKYVVQQGWEPNYVELNGLQVSRVNILAVVLSKEGNSFLLDDGTGKIQTRLFTENKTAENINPGHIVLIIGKPREYNNERYIVPEILRIIENKKWIEHRKKELAIEIDILPSSTQEINAQEENVDNEIEKPVEQPRGPNYSKTIIECIRKLDKGDGASTDEVIKESKLKEAEDYIETLLNEGEIFELRPGKLKILE